MKRKTETEMGGERFGGSGRGEENESEGYGEQKKEKKFL